MWLRWHIQEIMQNFGEKLSWKLYVGRLTPKHFDNIKGNLD